ncbi:CBS domain-containing protein [Euhalothece natronophila Z-M001]|uniref:CBS domain-containing protein n=1 Tax=Euhalothece natronophila Z-M001 TaxID=522448 RepID=A0A5B8NKV0_9CHRO|nr:CBS domain-containing protein [Euhalothece natronophila]QDZ39704.1 CBS domain-containing protein [Euhalothece natronophila Z-M001]
MLTLILCHQTADFDALGAAVGLTRLHTGSKFVLTGGAHPGVKSFLALHRDELAVIEQRSVHPEDIETLIVVDTQHRQRLGKAQSWFDLPQLKNILLYDHHPLEGDIPATITQIDNVGATCTLVVEELRANEASLSAIEATVMALGIHADTGSLTFPQSTSRDAKALAWLMEQGANISLIAEHGEPSLSPQLQTLFSEALDTVQTETIQGYTLGWVFLSGEKFVPGLSSVTERLIEVIEADALLLVHSYFHSNEHRASLIARCSIPTIDLNEILVPYGGGGHKQAASANLKTDHPQEILTELIETLKSKIPHPPTARELMSSPVRTILPDTTIDEAQRILLRYGHSGLSVVDENQELVGIISRRDLDLALHHGFGHAPVKGYMTRNLKTITTDTVLPDIEDLMVTYDVGRLPVLENHQLLGIVTRTDVLRQLHQERGTENKDQDHQSLVSACLLPNFKQRLRPELWKLLSFAATEAQKRGWHLYLVGGAVRDILLANPQQTDSEIFLQDIDLVVDGFHRVAEVGAGVELAKALQADYPSARLEVHGEFQTAALLWHNDPELDSLWIDIATARTEFYPYPAANPEVEASSIRQDLYRRDFTINALAIRLTSPKSGELLDFFGGLLDLRSGLIRVLHANSFIEDPTRIYRAVRFAVRLGFEVEAQTEDYIRYAIASGAYDRSRAENRKAPALQTRLKGELKYILEASYWQPALKKLSALNALKCLHPKLSLDRQLWWQLRFLGRCLRRFDPNHTLTHWQMRLEVMIASLPEQRVMVAQQLELPHDSIKRLEQLAAREEEVEKKLSLSLSSQEKHDLYETLRQKRGELLNLPPNQVQIPIEKTLFREGYHPYTLVKHLSSYKLPMLVLLAVRCSPLVRKRIWHYINHWSQVKAPVNGNDLKAWGYKPGPQYREMLESVLEETLNGVIQTKEEGKQFLSSIYES